MGERRNNLHFNDLLLENVVCKCAKIKSAFSTYSRSEAWRIAGADQISRRHPCETSPIGIREKVTEYPSTEYVSMSSRIQATVLGRLLIDLPICTVRCSRERLNDSLVLLLADSARRLVASILLERLNGWWIQTSEPIARTHPPVCLTKDKPV